MELCYDGFALGPNAASTALTQDELKKIAAEKVLYQTFFLVLKKS